MRTCYGLAAFVLGTPSNSNLDESRPLSWIDACLERERADLQVVERETPIRSNLVLITNASAHSSRRQRYEGKLSDDGNIVAARWEKSLDGTKWEHDFNVTYRRR